MEEEYFLFIAAAHLHQEFREFPVGLPMAEQVFQGTALRLHGFRIALEVDQRFQNGGEFFGREGTGAVCETQGHVINGQFNQFVVQGHVILHVLFLFPADDAVQGRLGDVQIPGAHQLRMWAPSTSASVMMMILW